MPHAVSPTREWLGHDLHVNDGKLPPEMIAPLKPTTLDTSMEEVRRRYEADGYVFLKGLIPRQDVLKAREEYFSMLAPSGVLKPGTKPVEGIFDSAQDPLDYPGIGAGGADANGIPTGPHPEIADQFVDLALKAHMADWYKETFCKHPALRDYIAKMTGWGVNTLPVTRTLLRNNTPGNKAIGVHDDMIFLRYGEDTAVTAWVPMGDVKIHGGGLIYLEGSNTLGSELETDFTRKARESGMTDEQTRDAFNANMLHGGMLDSDGPITFGKKHSRRWLLTSYEAGDVVLHKAYMVSSSSSAMMIRRPNIDYDPQIHASTINHDEEGVIRVGTDLRYVDKSKPWDHRWDKDFEFNDGV